MHRQISNYHYHVEVFLRYFTFNSHNEYAAMILVILGYEHSGNYGIWDLKTGSYGVWDQNMFRNSEIRGHDIKFEVMENGTKTCVIMEYGI